MKRKMFSQQTRAKISNQENATELIKTCCGRSCNCTNSSVWSSTTDSQYIFDVIFESGKWHWNSCETLNWIFVSKTNESVKNKSIFAALVIESVKNCQNWLLGVSVMKNQRGCSTSFKM